MAEGMQLDTFGGSSAANSGLPSTAMSLILGDPNQIVHVLSWRTTETFRLVLFLAKCSQISTDVLSLGTQGGKCRTWRAGSAENNYFKNVGKKIK